jgi:hypothetical protein
LPLLLPCFRMTMNIVLQSCFSSQTVCNYVVCVCYTLKGVTHTTNQAC